MKNINRPWLDERGRLLPTESLKEVSGNWTEKTWENYLATLEKPLREKLIEPKLYDELAARQDETIFQKFCTSSDPATRKLVRLLLDQISPTQALVIEKIFFEGRSERQASIELIRSRSIIKRRKKQALNRIKRLLTEGGPTLPYIGEHVLPPKDPFQKIDESYQEGFLTKDERNHLWALAELGGIKEGDLS